MRRVARRAGIAALAGGMLAAGACAGGSSSSTRPVPSLASSPAAAAAFEAIRAAWNTPIRAVPQVLEVQVVSFLVRFPDDGLAPLAHVYLALLALEESDMPKADHELELTKDLPPGTSHDMWTVAAARRLRMKSDPEGALALLRPLVGKTVDPVMRAVFEQELALAAFDTHRDYEAISYMDVWLRAASEEEKDLVRRRVASLVERLPRETLVGALQAMRTQRESYGYGIEIERILAQRLVQIATSSGDAALARMLLDEDAGAIVVAGEAGVELGELATSARGLNRVAGHTLGLLLPTESPALRDESADVLRGVMWALGLPRGVRDVTPTADQRTDAGAAPSRQPCAQPGSAPALEEPAADAALRLVTRDDAGSIDRTEVALDELAGEGAAVIVAGLDPQTAGRALRWGENHAVPVVVLVPPDDTPGTTGFSFVLGQSRSSVVDALVHAAPALGSGGVAPVVDASEIASFPPQGGRVGALTLLPPVSCDIPPTRAGDPRFPVSQWDHDGTHAWLVSGAADCARDLTKELSATRARGIVGLTLEGASLPAHPASLRVVTAAAGAIPVAAFGAPHDEDLRRFIARLGIPTWWTALGRDAATLARLAIRPLPADTTGEAQAVTTRRAQARDALAAARAPLWSTETTGWTASHVIERTVCAIE
ncbi:MAG TPA: hypothetical protein VF765_01945 [Polyangiaceae bacterium]